MEQVREQHPTAVIEVWAQDEQRAGLKPVLRRVWAKVGCRPTAPGRHRYEWLYVHGFVHPRSGRTWFYLWSGVDAELFELTLREFARAHRLGPEKQAVILLDQAGWHTCFAVDPERLPEGLHLVFQPAGSPELQPAERLWVLLNEAVANRCFADLAALRAAIVERIRALAEQRERVRALTWYDWFRAAEEQTLGALP